MIDVVAPIEQEGTKAVVRAWLKAVGDAVVADEPLVELETDKVAVEVPAPAAGVLAEIVLATDADAPPGAVLGRISQDQAQTAHVERSRDTTPTDAELPSSTRPSPSTSSRRDEVYPERLPWQAVEGLGKSGGGRELRLSPSVKRAVIHHGLDPANLEGTGRNGRLTRADVDRAVAQAPAPQPQAAPLAFQAIPHDRMRLRIAENMLASVTQAPHVTAVFEADFGAIIAHRERHKAAWAKDGVKLTYTAYLVAAAAEAMKVAPAINGRWHDDRLELFADVNIGVGTALGEKGLIVPVLARAQALSLREIAAGLDALVEKARAEKLTAADVRGGTFTISNHGVSGSLFAAPIIIPQPQSAILGVGKLEKRVVVREVGGQDAIQIRPMAYVSLTIDHRVVDGHQTNAWLTRFVEVLETWPAE